MSYVILQTSALKRKLESKTEALLILTEELNRCRIERDQYKFLAERDRNSVKKLAVCEVNRSIILFHICCHFF
jgi:hypothetical protein